jgi:hypothetical protein
MATIWGDPFTVSTLLLPIKPVLLDPVDEWGNPIESLEIMIIQAKLKASKRLRSEADISLPLQRQTVLFEGFVLSQSVELELLAGTKGTGTINGLVGEIKLLPVGQSSIGFLTNLLGTKLLIEFSQTVTIL